MGHVSRPSSARGRACRAENPLLRLAGVERKTAPSRARKSGYREVAERTQPDDTEILRENGVHENAIELLAVRGIQDLRQLVALAAVPGLADGLTEDLGLDETSFARLLERLRQELPSDELEKLERYEEPDGRLGCLELEVTDDEDDSAR